MKKLSFYTKLTPEKRIEKTNQFVNLFKDQTEDEENKDKLSAYKKSKFYGIKITSLDELHKGYYMKQSVLIGGDEEDQKKEKKVKKGKKEKKPIDLNDDFIICSKKISKEIKWLCIYRKSNNKNIYEKIYQNAKDFYETLESASKKYSLSISEPQWVEMEENSEVEDWTEEVEYRMKEEKYSFVVFLLDRKDNFYKDLKIHSLCNNGYVNQIVKFNSLKRNSMSVCSKILLQINSKLSGVSYMLKLDKTIKERKLMIIGVDSSHIKGRRTGVAMVATFNPSFTNFYNKELIIQEEKKSNSI